MKRFFTDYLLEWKDSNNRKPMIVRGARQVGKSFIIQEFGEKNFTNTIVLNFEQQFELHQLFHSKDPKNILLNLEVFSGEKIVPGKTLLFLDEIQICPDAILSLRYFYENIPELHIIAAGSLLDHALNKLQNSMPVGRVEFAYMYPMSFYEFLWATGETSAYEFLQNYQLNQEIPELIHQKFLQLLRVYYIVGGMPEAVKVYAENKSMIDVQKVHESILRSLEFDFGKYGNSSQRDILSNLLNYVPKSVGHKFKYANFDSGTRSNIIRENLRLLSMSRLIHFVYSSKSNSIPLQYGVNEKVFKLLFIDIGLFNHILKIRLSDISNQTLFHEGSLAEQFVGQELLCRPPYFLDNSIYYWAREKRNSEAELDYIIESNRNIIPVEVKSGKAGRLKSLQIYVSEKKLKKAIRIYAGLPMQSLINTNIKTNGKLLPVTFSLLSIPLYLSFEVERLFNQNS